MEAPAQLLTNNYVTVTSAEYLSIPYGASLYSGNVCYGAPNRPGAFLLDDNCLWPVSCEEIVEENESQITFISDQQWDSYCLGPPLYCL